MNINPIRNISFGRIKRTDAENILKSATTEEAKNGAKEVIIKESHNHYFDIMSSDNSWKVVRTSNLPSDFPHVEFKGDTFFSFSEAAKASDAYKAVAENVLADRERNFDKITDEEFLTTFTIVG